MKKLEFAKEEERKIDQTKESEEEMETNAYGRNVGNKERHKE